MGDKPPHEQGESALSRRSFLRATAGTSALAAGVGSGAVGSAAADGIDTPWLSVDGNTVEDPMGNEVILRGVNVADPKRLNTTASARGKNAEQAVRAATSDEWNARMIRLPVHPWDVAELPPVPVAASMDDPPDSFVPVSGANAYGYYEPPIFTQSELEDYVENHLKPIVETCVEQDVYCIVDYHRHWGQGNLAWATLDQYGNPKGPNPKLDEEVRTFWGTMAPHFADTPNVIFEVYNEPTKPGWGPMDVVWRGWKSVAQPWVDVIREHAPRNLVLIGSPRWCRYPQGVFIEEFDGDNLGYTYHVYPGHAVTDFDEDTGNAWEKVPLFVTEWGYTDGRCDWVCGSEKRFGAPFKQWAEERPVHWTAWCFDPIWRPTLVKRNFETEDQLDAIGDPYSGTIPEQCSALPCEWGVRDANTGYAGGFVQNWLAETSTDQVPTVDYDPEPPLAPPNLAVEDVARTAMNISWNGATDPGDSPLEGYRIYLNGDLATTVEAGTTATTLTDLLSDTEYEVGVAGVDVAGNEGDQATATATTEAYDDETPPGVPGGLSVADKTHVSVTLAWDGVDDTGPSGLHHYDVFLDGEKHHQVPAGTTETTIEDRQPDTSYDVAVSAVDVSQNESARTDPLAVLTEVDRPGPRALVINDFADGDGWPDSNELGKWIGTGGLSMALSGGTLTVGYDGGWFGSAVATDVSQYRYLKIRVRGASGGEESAITVDFAGVEAPLAEVATGSIAADRMSLLTVDMEAAGGNLAEPGQFRLGFEGSGTVELDAIWLDDRAPGGDDPVATPTPTTPDPIQGPTDTPTSTEDGMDVEPVLEGQMPQDVDADGLAEDVTGDGELDFNDLVAYYQHSDDPAMTDHSDAYDYTDDGELDFNDLVALYQEMQG